MDSSKKNDYYRRLIVSHYNNPINKGLLKKENSIIFHHYSNSCVDDFYIELIFKNNVVTDAKFEGMGCAISTASIDIYLSLIINKDLKEVMNIDKNYQAMLKNEPYDEELLVDLNAFHNVFKQPNRVRCALIISESIANIKLNK